MEYKEYKLSELSKDNKGTYGIGASAVEYSKDLYTYLRIESILEKENLEITNLSDEIYNDTDRELRMKILELENTLNYSYTTRLPSVLANYLYEMCVNMNAFYEKNHINNLEEKNKKQDWLFILELSNRIIKEMLELLSIKIPNKM